MTEDTERYDDELASIVAQADGFDGDGAQWRWLGGGGAHKNFLVTAADGESQCVVKLWNREWEQVGVIPPAPVAMQNTRIAGELEIGASVLALVREPLSLVLEFIPGEELDVQSNTEIAKLASVARRLHDSKAVFFRDFNPFAEARVILASACQAEVPLPDGFDSVRPTLERIESTLDLRANEFVPCHNDLYGSNVLCTPDGELRLIDYDLSGNGDRSYDLGFISTYSKFDPDQTAHLVESYFGEVTPALLARVHLFAIAADYSTLALWIAAQAVANKNDDYDYAGYMQECWKGVCSKIDNPNFGQRLEFSRR
jgi:hypothetical protein